MPASSRRRHLLRATAALVAAHALPLSAQESKSPLRVIVPLPAGGVADTSVRFFGEQWTAATRQSVVVDNRPGGSYLTGTMVAFKGGPDTVTALAQNEIHMALSALRLVIPFKGKIKPIAIWTDQRAPMTPDVPTFREQGLGDIPELNYWGSLAAPAGTPAAAIAALNKTMVEVMKVPALVAKFAAQGMLAKTSSPEAMVKIITDELKWISPLAAELNLKG